MEATASRTDSGVLFRTSTGAEVRGTLVRVTRESIVFEVYSPFSDVKPGEALQNFSVLRDGQPIYAGGAEVGSVLSTGRMLVVTATPLGAWQPANGIGPGNRLWSEPGPLLRDWEDAQSLQPAYQIAVSNIRSFLDQLSHWLAPVDLAAEVSGASQSPEALSQIAEDIHATINPKIAHLFRKWEEAWRDVPPEAAPAHRVFAQRELHPLTLCAPFVHRTYTKPLGFAGDYEMVNLILRNAMEGPSTYARVLHSFFIRTDAAAGHRNRIVKLADYLKREARRASAAGRDLRVLNLGCGPASEVEQFIRTEPISGRCDMTLLDFNGETIEYARQRLAAAARETGRSPRVRFVQKSITDVLREAVRCKSDANQAEYDFVYCAGLFDYLSDKVCARLLQLMSTWVLPGGLLLVTNVHPRHTVHAILEDLLEWHLVLRTEQELQALVSPELGEPFIESEEAGVNVLMSLRKPG